MYEISTSHISMIVDGRFTNIHNNQKSQWWSSLQLRMENPVRIESIYVYICSTIPTDDAVIDQESMCTRWPLWLEWIESKTYIKWTREEKWRRPPRKKRGTMTQMEQQWSLFVGVHKCATPFPQQHCRCWWWLLASHLLIIDAGFNLILYSLSSICLLHSFSMYIC